MKRLSGAWLILGGLLLGLAVGALLAAVAPALAPQVAAVADPIGGIWLDALRMTIVPLVFALLVQGVGVAAEAAEAGGVTARAMLVFALVLLTSALVGAIVYPLLLDLFPLNPAAAAALRGGLASAEPVPSIPPIGEWLRSIIPANPVKAAADSAMLPLVIFALIFGFAASRISVGGRTAIMDLMAAITDTMLVIVRWVLAFAPLGVFALGLATAARTGLAAIGGLAHYLALYLVILAIVTAGGYVLAVLFGRQPFGRFARAALPAQSIGLSTQSSLAALPAMIDAARGPLGLGEEKPAIVLPMAVALMRATSPAANLGIVLYVAMLAGVTPGLTAMIAGTLVAAVISLASVSIPSTVTFFITTVPIALAMGVPLAPLALFVAVEQIPDLLRTVGNVTYDLAATTVAARRRS